MPFYDEAPKVHTPTAFGAIKPKPAGPSLTETLGAAFRSENSLVSAYASSGRADPYAIEEGFDVTDYIGNDPKFSAHLGAFVGVHNRKSADEKKAKILQEEADMRTIESAGMTGIAAMMGAGLMDPTTLVFGAFGKAASVGRSLLGGAARTAVLAGSEAAVSEGILQAQQETRSTASTGMALGGSFLVGGALGALATRFTAAESKALAKRVDAEEGLAMDISEEFTARSNLYSSAGAAARDEGPLVLKDEALISKLPIINRQDPLIRLQLGESTVGRGVVRELAETPLEYVENAKGVATTIGGSVETRIKMWNAPLSHALRDTDTEYAKYFHSKEVVSPSDVRFIGARGAYDRLRGGQKLTAQEFREEVGRAAYSMDKHVIPEVAAAAAHYRKLDNSLKDAAVEAGLLSDDVKVKGDVSHRFRMYNKEKIIANRKEFAAILEDYFAMTQRRAAKTVERRAAILEKTGKPSKGIKSKADAEKTEEFADLSPVEIKEVVNSTIDTILGHADGRVPYDMVAGPRGALKERTLSIATSKIHDFVENDIEKVMRAQMRTLGPDIELARKFGSADMAEQIRQINDEATVRLEKATTSASQKKIEDQRNAAIRDVEGIRDRLRGTYSLPNDPNGVVLRAGRVARNLNYVRLLGGMTISAIPDLAKTVFTHGLSKTFKYGLAPLAKSVASWDFAAIKAAGAEVRAAGTALDMVLDARSMSLGDITDDFGRHTIFERGLSATASKFSVVTLMAPWNASLKQFAGLVTMTNLLKTTEQMSLGKATAKDVRQLAAAGIDEDRAKRIWAQYSKHGDTQGDVLLAKGELWDDKGALESFRAAVVRDVDRIIVTPGQDKPLWMSTELGKTIGQFKSFGVSSVQRTLLSGIQQRDAATLNGTLLMLALGGLTTNIKEVIADRPVTSDPAQWIGEAVDKSGLVGYFMDVNATMEKVTEGRVGLSALTGKQISRYASRSAVDSLLGPTVGLAADLAKLPAALTSEEMSRQDVRNVRKIVPFQNLFYLRGIFDQVEEAIGDSMGLEKTKHN